MNFAVLQPSLFRPDVFGRSGENLFVFIYFQMLSYITSHSITVSLFFRFRPNFLYLRSIFLLPIRPEFFFSSFLFIPGGCFLRHWSAASH